MKKIPHFNYMVSNTTGKYQTLEDWKYKWVEGIFLKIPKGFTTNGASIPRIFWWILSPFNPRYIEECTVHDYLCDLGQFKRANAWFNQLLKDNSEVNRCTRKILMFGVKSWHKAAYKEAGYFGRAKPRYLVQKVKELRHE